MDERGLGKRLQEARQAAGLTQQQLCQKANLSFSTLTKIERGAIKSPSIFTIQAIAGAVGLSLDELVGQITPVRNLKKTKSGSSFIYFDISGTLILYYQRAFAEIARDTGAQIEAVEAAHWHFNDEICRGEMNMDEFNAKFAERIGVESLDWFKYYLAVVEPVKEMHDVVEWASENYKIGLLTNIMPGLLNQMKSTGILPKVNFDAIVDSSEVGIIKPDPKIYEIARELAGCPPQEILFIDDIRSNLTAAEKQGWNILSFDDSHPAQSAEYIRQALEPAN
jgi:epoxide hydrolase-like predicted phosphatase